MNQLKSDPFEGLQLASRIKRAGPEIVMTALTAAWLGASACGIGARTNFPSTGNTPDDPSTSTIVTSDSFNRADSTTLGSTDASSGGIPMDWLSHGAVFEILHNDLTVSSFNGGTPYLGIETGHSDCSIQLKLTHTAPSGLAGIMFRSPNSGVDSSIHFVANFDTNSYSLQTQWGTSPIEVWNYQQAPAVSDLLKVEFKELAVRMSLNGSIIGTHTLTDPTQDTGTVHGIIITNGSAHIDDFLMEDCRR